MGARDRLLQANATNTSTHQDQVAPNLVEEIVESLDMAPSTEEPPVDPEMAKSTTIEEPVVDMAESTTTFIFNKKRKHVKEKCTTIRLYPELYEQLELAANANNSSVNEIINQVLSRFFNIDIE